MEVAVKGRNIPVTEALERYATEKVERIARYFDDEHSVSRAEIELIHERNASNPEPEVADTTLFINGTVLKARETSANMYASIDLMSHKLERQVRRYRGRQLDRWQGQKAKHAERNAPVEDPRPALVEEEIEEIEAAAEEIETRIVRTKQFQMKPMSPEEAALQMDLLDHAFFVFTSADTGEINVVYRRRDNNYGLIEPAR
ncbi:MAG: ribosome-associated translation inhibitor RaiA [Rubrobacter sp.]|nr:ribosome-associated translation inhibitor RaiA [Rubrobacter sp.]